ncbi:hypothetical protein BGZ65_012341, partial [Modicella reniformis]
FFYEEPPKTWTPTRFAAHSKATDFGDYINGPSLIKSTTPSLGVYSSSIFKYLREEDGKEETQVKRTIELRKAMYQEKEEELILKSKTSINLMKGRLVPVYQTPL